jgi:hypothetical protein
LFLIQNGLTEFNALAANVNIAWSLDQRTNIAIAFATKGTESVLFGGATAAGACVPAACHDFLT